MLQKDIRCCECHCDFQWHLILIFKILFSNYHILIMRENFIMIKNFRIHCEKANYTLRN
jgi:hypothetical protein